MNPEQIAEITDEQLTDLVGQTIYAGVRSLVDQGMTAQTALRIVAATYVAEALGPMALDEMGVPTSTARRWRATLKRYMAESPDEPPQAVLDDVRRYVEQKQKKERELGEFLDGHKARMAEIEKELDEPLPEIPQEIAHLIKREGQA